MSRKDDLLHAERLERRADEYKAKARDLLKYGSADEADHWYDRAQRAIDKAQSIRDGDPQWEWVNGDVDRLPVPSGWLYSRQDGGALTFVPDPHAPHVKGDK